MKFGFRGFVDGEMMINILVNYNSINTIVNRNFEINHVYKCNHFFSIIRILHIIIKKDYYFFNLLKNTKYRSCI